MSKSNAFAQDLNRAAREPIGGLSIEQIRQQVIDHLQGKRTVSVDYRRIKEQISAGVRMMSLQAKKRLR